MTPLGRLMIVFAGFVLASSAALAQSGVGIEVDQFGAGNAFRQGERTAVRLKLTSNLDKPTAVWVQWEVPNADGDIEECGRSLTVTPTQPSLTWLYAYLPPDASPSNVWAVRVFEERDGTRRGEIGGTRIGPAGAQAVEIGTSMIATIGQSHMGLRDYSNPGAGMSRMIRPVSGHEDTRIVTGLRPSQLPDRWDGLLQYEAVAWSGDNVPPQELGLDQAEALREYVRHGGHLIISLPSTGNQWGLGVAGQTELEELLPCRTAGKVPRKDDAVALSTLLPALSKYNAGHPQIGSRKPPEFSIRVFKDLRSDFDVIDNHFQPLISLTDGRVIAIQRLFGHGRVTVIGIDLSDGRLSGLDLPQADAFWNRVLGRRMDTPSPAELKRIADGGRLAKADLNSENSLGAGALVTGVINMEGPAGKGLLLALMLFAAYWLLAGPGGFALLKHYKQVRHAWVAFAACAAVFTAIAWGGVSLFPKHVQISHVTFLDHVARTPDDPRTSEPQYQRAVSYLSAYLPQYGNVPIEIASSPDRRDFISSWTPPGVGSQKFPNVDRYRVDSARSPASYSLPARSTATQLYANWMGGLDPNWGGTLLVDPKQPITVETDAGGTEYALRGRIINELPGRLTNVTVLWVKNNRLTRRRYAPASPGETEYAVGGITGAALNSTEAWRLPASLEWGTGQGYDLAQLVDGGTNLNIMVKRRYGDVYAKRDLASAAGNLTVADGDRRNYMEMLSIFNQLNPPDYLSTKDAPNLESIVAFHRELGRELDLSAWFNRPCLIIMGFLEGAPCPVPLRIDGEGNLPVANGLTMVRWIYPLPINEKIAFREVFEQPNP